MADRAQFLSPLHLQDIDGEHFQVLIPLVFRASDGTDYTVPAGAVTDFASVPQALWSLLPPFGDHSRASVLHDWLYQAGTTTRGKADSLFKDAMQACGVGWFTRQSLYLGVRAGGWVAWKRHRSRSSTGA